MDPNKRWLLCSECGELVPLDSEGYFATHTNADKTGLCSRSGTQAVLSRPARSRPIPSQMTERGDRC
jgi:hypothetical protein